MAFVAPNAIAKQVIAAGPQGASEVKRVICKVGYDVSGPLPRH
jgi:hypothetical protein